MNTVSRLHRLSWCGLMIVAAGLLGRDVNAASFDCALAKTAIEKSICGNEELSTLDEYLGTQQPVGLAWQIAFHFPCLRPPHIIDGITEPPTAAVMWGDRPLSGLGDGSWQTSRGGIFGQVQRTQSTLELLARFPDQPGERRIQGYLFASPLARDAYTVTHASREQSGFSTATG